MKLKYVFGLLLLATGLICVSCNDDDDISVATGNIITQVTTGDPVSVTAVSAVLQGTVRDLSQSASSSYAVGVYYGTSSDPTTSGTAQVGSIDENGTVTATLSGLTTGTTYYYAAYVTLQKKVTTFGEVKSFVATDAVVATPDATNVTATKATLNGQFNGVDGLDESTLVTGVKLASTAEGIEDAVSYPVGEVTGLLPGTTYYYAAYAVVGGKYVYGETKSLTTSTQEISYVDLGLGVMWAQYNLGAESESEVGTLIGYGDPTGMQLSESAFDYPSTDISATGYDAAYALYQAGALETESRMPTAAEINELVANTTQTMDEVDGVSGIRFTATNGNSIFMPYTGYRSGGSVTSDGNGYYWSGNVDVTNADYASMLSLNGSSAEQTYSQRALGLAIRPVCSVGFRINNSKLVWGDLENNGRLRIEIFNQYGSTAADPAVNTNAISFSRNMVVTFSLSGITGNLKEGAAGSYVAGLQYADASWDPSYWSGLTAGDYEAVVTGDGTYTVWMEVSSLAEGAVVFCIDIADLSNDLVDASLVQAEIVSMEFDTENAPILKVDNSKLNVGDLENNGKLRIEIYNEYGATAGDPGINTSAINFSKNMAVTFTLSGITGNLKEGAAGSYVAGLEYADASWDPSYWSDLTAGDYEAIVTGDGTYTVWMEVSSLAEGAVVFCIDIAELWNDIVDTSLVWAEIVSIELDR